MLWMFCVKIDSPSNHEKANNGLVDDNYEKKLEEKKKKLKQRTKYVKKKKTFTAAERDILTSNIKQQ